MSKQSSQNNSSSEVTRLSPQLNSPAEEETKNGQKPVKKRTASPKPKLPSPGEEGLALPGVPQPSHHRMLPVDRNHSNVTPLHTGSGLNKDSVRTAAVSLSSSLGMQYSKPGATNFAQEQSPEAKVELTGKKLSFLDEPPSHYPSLSSRLTLTPSESAHRKSLGKKMSAAHRISLTGEAPLDRVHTSTPSEPNMFIRRQSGLTELHQLVKRHSDSPRPSSRPSASSSVFNKVSISHGLNIGSNFRLADKPELSSEPSETPLPLRKSLEQQAEKLVVLEAVNGSALPETLRQKLSGLEDKMALAVSMQQRKERNVSARTAPSETALRKGSSRTPDNLVLIEFDPSNRKKPVGRRLTGYSGATSRSLVDVQPGAHSARSQLSTLEDVKSVIASVIEGPTQKLGNNKRKVCLIVALLVLLVLTAALAYALIQCLKNPE